MSLLFQACSTKSLVLSCWPSWTWPGPRSPMSRFVTSPSTSLRLVLNSTEVKILCSLSNNCSDYQVYVCDHFCVYYIFTLLKSRTFKIINRLCFQALLSIVKVVKNSTGLLSLYYFANFTIRILKSTNTNFAFEHNFQIQPTSCNNKIVKKFYK